MKILLLTHAYNCLCQRLHIELKQLGHDVSIEFDINDQVSRDAVQRYQPELIIAPFLKSAIPDDIWQQHLCWIVHPGIIGDRGPSSLDWAILNQEKQWGVTVLQANEVMDGGDIWASESFTMRNASKSSLYRQEVTRCAVKAVKQALTNLSDSTFKPTPLCDVKAEKMGQWRCLLTQAERAIDWQQDSSEEIVRKIHAADGNPGLLTELLEQEVYLFNASIDHGLKGAPGTVIATKNNAIAIGTIDAAIWVSHLRKKPQDTTELTLKLPAALVLAEQLKSLNLNCAGQQGYKEIWHHVQGDIAYLYFNFYNGAMGTEQCQQLTQAYLELAAKDVRAIMLMGGTDFWSNGIHLNLIEHAESAADESWRNINAMNDLCQAIIETTDKLTIAALNGNAGAGGVFLALACDIVAANEEVVLNPHYKSMGNLFGSEYWTYLLPKRVGTEKAHSITQNRLPLGAIEARELGLVDLTFADEEFLPSLIKTAQQLISVQEFATFISAKQEQRAHDEAERPLAEYRRQELAQMQLNFYGFDPSYHVARYHFVYKLAKSRTPAYLAKHRVAGYQV